MSVFCVRCISFEPLVGFTTNCAQILNMIQGAVHMFDQGQIKDKVIVYGFILY